MIKYDAVIVIGRGISQEGFLPDTSRACVEKSVDLYKAGITSNIIFSGKWSRHYTYIPPKTEAKAMSNLAIQFGLPEKAIILEEESLDTISNFYLIKTKILIPNNLKTVLLLKLNKNAGRAPFLMKKILGPEYLCESLSIDFDFPTERLKELELSEAEKLERLKVFLKDIPEGDHETIMKRHLDYVRDHS